MKKFLFEFNILPMKDLKPPSFFLLDNFQHKAIFASCNYVWEALLQIKPYLQAQKLGTIEAEIPQGAYLIDKHLISIGKGSIIEPGAYIKGPCLIGENCIIRHGAYLRGCIITGNNCVLGHDSEFKNALLLNEAHAAHFAYVGDTILGNRVNLGAGTVCANLKLNRSPISLHFNNELINTGLKKFGAIVGDESQIGCNTVTNPGTLLGKAVFCYPCTNFGGIVSENHIVRSSAKAIFSKR